MSERAENTGTTGQLRSTRWRGIISAVAAALLAVGGLTLGEATAAQAASVSVTIDGVVYTADDADPAHTATITRYTGTSVSVLPLLATVTIGGTDYTVTAIGDRAFASSLPPGPGGSDLVFGAVTIPDTVKTIGYKGFGFTRVDALDLGHGVQEIADWAFAYSLGQSTVATLTIPDGVVSIGFNAFRSALFFPGLAALHLGRSVQSIGESAFHGHHLTEVEIPASVTSIGPGAFANNPELTTVRFAGKAPTIAPASAPAGSFDPTGPTLGFPWRYGAAAGVANGYTTPTWQGYDTVAEVTVAFRDPSGTDLPSVTLDQGDTVTKPTDPTRDGHTFTGWYTDDGTTTPYDFGEPVETDLTLYAGWRANSYTVAFNNQGGSTVPSETVTHGDLATEPAAPTRAGSTFTGWYTDPAATNLYDFATPVTTDLALYAGWRATPSGVTFDSQGGSAVRPQKVTYGGPATEPAAPTRAGYTFTGWYTDPAATTSYDFATPVTGRLTLYAGWTAVPVVPPASAPPAPIAVTGALLAPWVPVSATLAIAGGLALLWIRRSSRRIHH